MQIIKHDATLEEYLQIDANSDERLEFINGTIVSVSGVTIEHSQIYTSLVVLLHKNLMEKGFLMVSSQMKLYVSDNCFLCPDVHIYKKEVQKQDMKYGYYALKEPIVIIEILSASTTAYDKDEKFECYRQIKSLKKYIMIESDLTEEDENGEQKPKKEPKIYVRDIEKENKFEEEVLNLEGILDILGCKVSVKDIYEPVI